MKRIMIASILCVLGASLGLLSGCNTVKGIGKDVSNGGKEIQRAAT